jgi:hypothetical protein
VSSSDPVDAYRKDWERRKAISARFGRPCLAAAGLCLFSYILIESGLPTSPHSETGHVFRIFWIARTYGRGPLFVYGAHWQQWLAISAGFLGATFFIAAGVIYYLYNPGAFYRGAKGELRE